MHIKVILSFIVLTNCFFKSSASDTEGLLLLVQAIEIRSNMNFSDLKKQIKEKRTEFKKDAALSEIHQNPSKDSSSKKRKKYWKDADFRRKKIEKARERYYKNKQDDNEENNNNNNNLKSSLSDEALSIATTIDMSKTNVSDSSIEISSKVDEKLQNRINNRIENSEYKVSEINVNFSKYDRNACDKMRYWTNHKAREEKLAKMRKRYAQKKALEKALLSNQSSNN